MTTSLLFASLILLYGFSSFIVQNGYLQDATNIDDNNEKENIILYRNISKKCFIFNFLSFRVVAHFNSFEWLFLKHLTMMRMFTN